MDAKYLSAILPTPHFNAGSTSIPNFPLFPNRSLISFSFELRTPMAFLTTIAINFAVLGASILLISRFGTLRTRGTVIYYTHALAIAYFLLQGRVYVVSLLTLGVLHSMAHHLWPFITLSGLNIKASAFPDVLVHLSMHMVVHKHLVASTAELSRPTIAMSTLILASSVWNAYLASYSKVNEPWFIWMSISQALSTGSWVGYLCASEAGMLRESMSVGQNRVFELVLWAMWAATLANWFVFKSSSRLLKRLFRMSYLDTLFVVPVWIHIWRSGSI